MPISATLSNVKYKGVAGGHPGSLSGTLNFSGAYSGGALTIGLFKKASLEFRHWTRMICNLAANGNRGALTDTLNVDDATNADPIEITTVEADHGLLDGMEVTIADVVGNTNANATARITKTGANTFTMNGVAGNAAYVSGGTITPKKNKNWLGYFRLFSSGTTEQNGTVATTIDFHVPLVGR